MQLGDRDASPCRESKSHCCASFFQIFKDFDELLKFCLHFCPRYLELRSGESSKKDFLTPYQPVNAVQCSAWICIAELAIAILGYEVKFIIKPHQMVDNSFSVMNLLFILWCPLSPNSSTGSLFDPRRSGRQEQFPAQRPLWISWTSRRRRRIVSIEIATSA